MKERSVLIFDMDGVLVDVSESYLATIAVTAQHFTGKALAPEAIEEYKQAGGWNNDWALTHKIIQDTGCTNVSYPEVVAAFQSFFLGPDNDGLITREKWIPANGLLDRLTQNHRLAIFTGRPRAEANLTLRRFAPHVIWDPIIAEEDVPNPKPAPDGLRAIAAENGGARQTYVGDNVDDARSARAAGVLFIGVAASHQSSLRQLLREEGANAVIPDVNKIEEVI